MTTIPARSWPTCTIREHRGDVAGQTMTYYGDGANNMANSYVLGGVNAEDVGVGHVVGPIAVVGHGLAGDVAAVFADREQVGQDLAVV